MLPGKLTVLEAVLETPSSIHASWIKPDIGGPIDGYNVIYWDDPENMITVPVDKEVIRYLF